MASPAPARDGPWLLPSNRKLRALVSVSLRNLSLVPSSPARARGKTIDDDALPQALKSPAKLVALREQRSLGHSRSSADLRSVAGDAVVDAGNDGAGDASGSPRRRKGKGAGAEDFKDNRVPRTPVRPVRMRRRSTLEWANATPQTRQERLESVTAERMADVFFSAHVEGVEGWYVLRHKSAWD
jgi:UV radiation resistance-associated gene protein